MPKFNVKFSREVTVRDEYVETIEAATIEEARAKARTMASEFNHSCPDGATEVGSPECADWDVDGIDAVTAENPAATEVETEEA